MATLKPSAAQQRFLDIRMSIIEVEKAVKTVKEYFDTQEGSQSHTMASQNLWTHLKRAVEVATDQVALAEKAHLTERMAELNLLLRYQAEIVSKSLINGRNLINDSHTELPDNTQVSQDDTQPQSAAPGRSSDQSNLSSGQQPTCHTQINSSLAINSQAGVNAVHRMAPEQLRLTLLRALHTAMLANIPYKEVEKLRKGANLAYCCLKDSGDVSFRANSSHGGDISWLCKVPGWEAELNHFIDDPSREQYIVVVNQASFHLNSNTTRVGRARLIEQFEKENSIVLSPDTPTGYIANLSVNKTTASFPVRSKFGGKQMFIEFTDCGAANNAIAYGIYWDNALFECEALHPDCEGCRQFGHLLSSCPNARQRAPPPKPECVQTHPPKQLCKKKVPEVQLALPGTVQYSRYCPNGKEVSVLGLTPPAQLKNAGLPQRVLFSTSPPPRSTDQTQSIYQINNHVNIYNHGRLREQFDIKRSYDTAFSNPAPADKLLPEPASELSASLAARLKIGESRDGSTEPLPKKRKSKHCEKIPSADSTELQREQSLTMTNPDDYQSAVVNTEYDEESRLTEQKAASKAAKRARKAARKAAEELPEPSSGMKTKKTKKDADQTSMASAEANTLERDVSTTKKKKEKAKSRAQKEPASKKPKKVKKPSQHSRIDDMVTKKQKKKAKAKSKAKKAGKSE